MTSSDFFPKLWRGPVPDQLWKNPVVAFENCENIASFCLKIVKKLRRFFRKLWKKDVFVKSVSISILNNIIWAYCFWIILEERNNIHKSLSFIFKIYYPFNDNSYNMISLCFMFFLSFLWFSSSGLPMHRLRIII